MLLKDYIRQRRITIADAARELKEHHDTVRKWAHGLRVPRPPAQRKIREWSGGAVTPADWIEQDEVAA